MHDSWGGDYMKVDGRAGAGVMAIAVADLGQHREPNGAD